MVGAPLKPRRCCRQVSVRVAPRGAPVLGVWGGGVKGRIQWCAGINNHNCVHPYSLYAFQHDQEHGRGCDVLGDLHMINEIKIILIRRLVRHAMLAQLGKKIFKYLN